MDDLTATQTDAPPPESDAIAGTASAPSRVAFLRNSFFLVVVCAMSLDAAPQSWSWLAKPKYWVGQVLNRSGLWQGEWMMFTPEPVLNNGWIQADIYQANQRVQYWSSPDWAETSAWEKFYRFRHINYYNRVKGNTVGGEALARYLAQQHSTDSPVRTVVLFQYRRTLLRDMDAPLPKFDESVWGGGQEFLFQRKFEP